MSTKSGESAGSEAFRTPSGRAADGQLLLDVARAVLTRHGEGHWAVRPTEKWCFLTPPDDRPRKHGWKLHVSATPLSAPIVLARAATVLVRRGCSFKFAPDLANVAQLVDIWQDRGFGGKFITAYPRDDEHFRVLATLLDEATEGLAGPQILSDKPFRPGGLVSSRYGAFHGDRRLTDDGVFVVQMAGPDGSVVDDVRNGWFSPPPWAVYPFSEQPAPPAAAPPSILLGGRFRVHRAIRHANKGGVFRGTDERDGAEVVVKQARAHVGARLDGTDVRDRLREEARMLDRLAPLRVAPAKVALFEEQGDLFLAEQAIPGEPLDAVTRRTDGAPSAAVLLTLARNLVDLVGTVHEAGLVINDLKPQNALATPDGEVVLVDVEHITERGAKGIPAYTRHYAAPEIVEEPRRGRSGLIADPAADCFSLGLTVFCMVTGLPATWVSGRPGARRSRAAREDMLAHITRTHPELEPFAALIVGLTQSDPEQRWTVKTAREYLAAAPRDRRSTSAATPMRPTSLDEVIRDGIAHLQRTMTPHKESLWRMRPQPRGQADPCNAWNGAAGGLKVLARAYAARPDLALPEDPLRRALEEAADWVDARAFAIPRLLPGLSFGRAGTAWALYEAADLLDDDAMAARALNLAKRLPLAGPSPDVTHGLSGAGLVHLHLSTVSGDEELRERALMYAEAVLKAARRDGDAWSWPHAKQADSALAGLDVYGYAHGVAGAGAFLLAAAQAEAGAGGSGEGSSEARERCMEGARGAADTLLAAALTDGGAPAWPSAVGGAEPSGVGGQWCNGQTGIGGFLLRFWAQTGEQRYGEAALECAAAVVRHAWSLAPGACCGLAGVGHFLLDAAQLTGQEELRADAEHVAGLLEAQHSIEAGPPKAAERDTGLDYAGGIAGVLDFLIRLRHGGPNPWTPTTGSRVLVP
ncbi:MAG TPA: class IV lanthionine synthetase LanL [Actinocrinis sp.]|nr:class IV lanthionine synthetase LanL [Actinocrinis sp.]